MASHRAPWVRWLILALAFTGIALAAGIALLAFEPESTSGAESLLGISAAVGGILAGVFFAIFGITLAAWLATPADERTSPGAVRNAAILLVAFIVVGAAVGWLIDAAADGDGQGLVFGGWIGGFFGLIGAFLATR